MEPIPHLTTVAVQDVELLDIPNSPQTIMSKAVACTHTIGITPNNITEEHDTTGKAVACTMEENNLRNKAVAYTQATKDISDSEHNISREATETTPWEAQVGWIYAGHSEWVQTDNATGGATHGNELRHEADWIKKWLVKNDKDIGNNLQVLNNGYPNRWGAKIEVESRWNLQLLEEQLTQYDDKEVVEWLRYGWPASRLPTLGSPTSSYKTTKEPQSTQNTCENT